MTVVREERAGCAVLAVHGDVDLSTGPRLAAAVSAALGSAGGAPVVLDLTGLQFLSSSGLGQLVALDDEARRAGTPLRVVVDLDRPAARPITTMGLDEVLTLFGSVDEAVLG
jgi:anti-sigma B factor antagonist